MDKTKTVVPCLLIGTIFLFVSINRDGGNVILRDQYPRPTSANTLGTAEGNRNKNVNSVKSEKCKRRLPQALIVGFAKCGTGTLKTFLNIHPDISAVMQPSEVKFFSSKNYTADYELYRRKMTCSFANQITLEKTPRYAVHPAVPERVYRMNKNMKIIFIVREPVSRVISAYAMAKAENSTKVNGFENMVLLKGGHVNKTDLWIYSSRYHLHVRNWLKYFNFSQMHFVDGENFVRNPAEELNKVEKFFGIRQYITSGHFIYSRDKGFMCLNKDPEGGGIDIQCMKQGKGRKHPDIDTSLLNKLYDFYQDENEQFYQLVGRRFNWTSINL